MSAVPPQWTPERVVDLALARRLLVGRVPSWEQATLEPFGEGWDNTAFLLDGHVVARFPRRAIASDLLEIEACVLPTLAPRLPLRVPLPRWVGGPSADFPWTWAAYELLAGRPLADADLGEDACRALASPLGRFLRALHDVDATSLRADGLPDDRLRRLDLPFRVGRVAQALETLVADGLLIDARPWHGVLDALPSDWRPRARCVVHGDLHARHLLVDDEGDACGVIDWGDVHFGDPALDLSAAFMLLPASGHDAFLSTYGDVDPASWAVARFRALHTALVVLPYAEARGDVAFGASARLVLERLRA